MKDIYEHIKNIPSDSKVLLLGNALSNEFDFTIEVKNHIDYSLEKFGNNLSLGDYDFKSSEDYVAFFKSIDLLNEFDIDNIDVCDYIELRYVLHLSKFSNEKKYDIIDKLYNKLNKNGSIGMQCYYKLSDNNKYKDYNLHNLWTDIDNEYISDKYDCDISKSSDDGGYYYILVIKK